MSFWENLFNPWKGVFRSFALYWRAYGGWSSFFKSPYLHIAIFISAITYPVWLCSSKESVWFDITLSILPNLLGFTLGGYAILLAFGDEKFRRLISVNDKEGEISPFMVINGTFVHFIMVQSFAILLSIVGNAWSIKTGVMAWLGFTFFLYSIMTGIAAALAILNIASWFEMWNSHDSK